MDFESKLALDYKGNPIPLMDLNDPQDIDGTGGTVQSNVIKGKVVRIVAITAGADIRFTIGDNPTAGATSHPVNGEIWMPIKAGQKVAIFGGVASIATGGVDPESLKNI